MNPMGIEGGDDPMDVSPPTSQDPNLRPSAAEVGEILRKPKTPQVTGVILKT